MRRRLVNHHRLIKNIDRTAEKTERFFDRIFRHRRPRKLKDFTWKGPQYNPYRKEDTTGNRKLLIEVSILLLSVFSCIYLVIFSGLFDITRIHITGNNRIPTQEIETVVINTLEYRDLGFIPNKSFFTASIIDITEVLKKRFPIEQIRIEKRFPHEITIEIKEKVSTLIYDNGEMYALVGIDGSVVELIRAVEKHEWKEIVGEGVTTSPEGITSTVAVVVDRVHTPNTNTVYGEQTPEFPIVYDKRGHVVEKGSGVLEATEAQLMISWYNATKNTDFGISYITIENTLDFYLTTRDGWIIKTRFKRQNPEDQIREIKLALQKNETRKNLSYIDVRYENRIYWK